MFPGKAAGNTCAGFGRLREAGPLAEEEKKHEAGTACVRAWNPKTDVYVPGATGLWECRSMECGGTDLNKGGPSIQTKMWNYFPADDKQPVHICLTEIYLSYQKHALKSLNGIGK